MRFLFTSPNNQDQRRYKLGPPQQQKEDRNLSLVHEANSTGNLFTNKHASVALSGYNKLDDRMLSRKAGGTSGPEQSQPRSHRVQNDDAPLFSPSITATHQQEPMQDDKGGELDPTSQVASVPINTMGSMVGIHEKEIMRNHKLDSTLYIQNNGKIGVEARSEHTSDAAATHDTNLVPDGCVAKPVAGEGMRGAELSPNGHGSDFGMDRDSLTALSVAQPAASAEHASSSSLNSKATRMDVEVLLTSNFSLGGDKSSSGCKPDIHEIGALLPRGLGATLQPAPNDLSGENGSSALEMDTEALLVPGFEMAPEPVRPAEIREQTSSSSLGSDMDVLLASGFGIAPSSNGGTTVKSSAPTVSDDDRMDADALLALGLEMAPEPARPLENEERVPSNSLGSEMDILLASGIGVAPSPDAGMKAEGDRMDTDALLSSGLELAPEPVRPAENGEQASSRSLGSKMDILLASGLGVAPSPDIGMKAEGDRMDALLSSGLEMVSEPVRPAEIREQTSSSSRGSEMDILLASGLGVAPSPDIGMKAEGDRMDALLSSGLEMVSEPVRPAEIREQTSSSSRGSEMDVLLASGLGIAPFLEWRHES
ncbi:hypothetical protein K474DRAFT_630544 [Panus rudis PR-1116 ss-1]|nr:hypothetical protein K474DRAFT_630544 [Panus rudis PR-1116 ss-1]